MSFFTRIIALDKADFDNDSELLEKKTKKNIHCGPLVERSQTVQFRALTLLHSKRPKVHRVLAALSTTGLISIIFYGENAQFVTEISLKKCFISKALRIMSLFPRKTLVILGLNCKIKHHSEKIFECKFCTIFNKLMLKMECLCANYLYVLDKLF